MRMRFAVWPSRSNLDVHSFTDAFSWRLFDYRLPTWFLDDIYLDQWLTRTEAEDFVEDFAGQAFALRDAEMDGLVVD
jgi:hypothetical protein